MIRLPPRSLDAATQQQLSQWQHEVDSLATYPARVETAKARFKDRNKKGNATFDVVRVQLVAMSHGARRCAYCEDSVGDEVEHIWPKDFFPERAFVWTNYLYACGGCNGAKLNRWRLRDAQGQLHDLRRTAAEREAKTYDAPPTGEPCFLDPRSEDPGAYLHLDLVDTFEITPRPGLGAWATDRAAWTIEHLKLNERPELIDARAGAYRCFVDHAKAHLYDLLVGAPAADLTRRRDALRRDDHPMVWHEMKRQRAHHPDLADLFTRAPELLDW